MTKKKASVFPRLIHVCEEGDGGEDTFLAVYTDGVASLDEHGVPVAIYQLVEVGQVGIQKSFQSTRKSKKKAK